ncbi:MAG: hypothetical protein ACOY5W_10520 [Pseudomonadota bacterium]
MEGQISDRLVALLSGFGALAAVISNLDAAREWWAEREEGFSALPNQLDFPEEFEKAYRRGVVFERQKTPELLYGMCFVKAYGSFERYIAGTLSALMHNQPRVLLGQIQKGSQADEKKYLTGTSSRT